MVVDESFQEIEKRAKLDKENEDLKLRLKELEKAPAPKPKNTRSRKKPEIQEDSNGAKFITVDPDEEEPDNIKGTVGAENKLELQMQALQAPKSETEAVTDAVLKMHEEKTNLTDKFLASKIQKTEVKKDHRVIIPIMNMLADCPFPNIANHIKDPVLKAEIENEFKIPYLKDFIEGFIDYGIPVDRKGRKEEVDVLTAYLHQQPELNMEAKQNKGFK